MTVIINNRTDPYFNLAAEEALFTLSHEGIVIVWRNSPAVVIGRNQNAYAEIRRAYAEENGIKLVRRLTGGGAVFHDYGNVNISFITDDSGEGADYAEAAAPIVELLHSLGIKAKAGGRNDVTVDGAKISGFAACVYTPKGVEQAKLLRHCTLLWDADLSHLEGVLRPDDGKLISKGIPSVRARVGNLRDMLATSGSAFAQMSSDDFFNYTVNFLTSYYNCHVREMSGDETTLAEKLADEKYSRWEWNYGESHVYARSYGARFPFGRVNVSLDTDGGVILRIKLTGDFLGMRDISELEASLTGVRLDVNEIEALLSSLPGGSSVGDYIAGAAATTLAQLIALG